MSQESVVVPTNSFDVLVAVDPWVVDFEGTGKDADLRVQALQGMRDLLDREESCNLRLLPFIDAAYWALDRTYPPPWQPLLPYIDAMCCEDERSDAPRAEVSIGLPPTPRRWLLAVQDALGEDSSPDWRNPIFLIPQARRHLWPAGEEVPVAGGGSLRVIAVLEDPESNALFTSDMDPWCCERARSVEKDGEVHTVRDLPRPSLLRGARMEEWQRLLGGADDSSTSTGEHLDFVPAREWTPHTIDKPSWRHCPFGEHGKKMLGGGVQKKGPRDRRGRTWAWDDAHHTHWDVQHEDSGNRDYMNVSTSGLIKKGYE
jgi:hypothetical protein